MSLADKIAEIQLPNTFNPFSDVDEEHDLPDAPKIRRKNLERFLEAMHKLRPRIAFIAEAPGYRGMRRTGLPMSSEVLLPRISEFLGVELEKATKTKVMSEITAKVVWDVIFELGEPVLLWNAVMVQPTKTDNYHNRNPKRSEVLAFAPILKEVLDTFRPEIVIAVGGTAKRALQGIGVEAKYVRHPAHGGAGAFKRGVAKLFETV